MPPIGIPDDKVIHFRIPTSHRPSLHYSIFAYPHWAAVFAPTIGVSSSNYGGKNLGKCIGDAERDVLLTCMAITLSSAPLLSLSLRRTRPTLEFLLTITQMSTLRPDLPFLLTHGLSSPRRGAFDYPAAEDISDTESDSDEDAFDHSAAEDISDTESDQDEPSPIILTQESVEPRTLLPSTPPHDDDAEFIPGVQPILSRLFNGLASLPPNIESSGCTDMDFAPELSVQDQLHAVARLSLLYPLLREAYRSN
ncbi:hypothetical protein B0H17DRAFT_1215527 [Mycena rosella]|uniref:Uncharacterized protein n=1 Tax=Mycena rosella TaxID=1033263 RepID=A0AAD7G104_MYCRO|nr:hypothetical protein B0H17DRAFT_1215527 [Mycena rosella]